jgi:glutathione peroxidase
MTGIYDYDFQLSDGNKKAMSDYKGKVLLIVNTASKCGFTPQFEGLETLYEKFRDKGLVILGFPCNQFGKQDPGSNEEIMEFCRLNYGVSFPMAGKIDVNGSNTHPMYDYLKKEAPGMLGSKTIKWNFTKFLVDAQGNVVERFASATAPEKIEAAIEELL